MIKNKIIYVIALLIVIIDFLSKFVVDKFMLVGQSIKIINKFLYITYAKNTGVAFSMFEGNVLVIIIITLIVIGLLIKYINERNFSKFEILAYGIIIGGAMGNLIDRIIYGYVIDFIDIYILKYDFPIFNIADISIVLGVVFILISSIIDEKFGDKNGNYSK